MGLSFVVTLCNKVYAKICSYVLGFFMYLLIKRFEFNKFNEPVCVCNWLLGEFVELGLGTFNLSLERL